MLRFFRHIRQSLIMPDNVRKYMLYAIGEILLVVIGILIALQVGNWNEERSLQESATYHLSLLNSDLKEDKTLLENNIRIFESNKESINRLLNAQMLKEPISAEIPADLVRLQLEYNFSPRKSGLEVLINTGEIGALPVDIQDQISIYYLALDALMERDQITNNYIRDKYETVIFDNYSYVFGPGNPYNIIADVYTTDTRPDFVFNEDQFLADRKLEALLVARMYQNQRRMELYQNALERLVELQNRIDSL